MDSTWGIISKVSSGYHMHVYTHVLAHTQTGTNVFIPKNKEYVVSSHYGGHCYGCAILPTVKMHIHLHNSELGLVTQYLLESSRATALHLWVKTLC